MGIGSPGRRAIVSAIYSFVMIGTIGYFGFAALQGEYGLARQAEIRALEAGLERELEAAVAERRALENRTRRLSDGYLDLELLDEQARRMLGLARSDEIVIR